MRYEQASKFLISNHPDLNESWVQNIIADDPTVLGLGDVILKDRERVQPRAGRLDLLLQDSETATRYEVEIQLDKTDESHIIRAIEYWDIERKRYPQYDHVAVIVAEDITSRFLNVISLFNGMIPLIAVQMNGLRIGEITTLVFTTVLDQMSFGMVDDDEEIAETTDRAYWEKRGTVQTVSLADELLEIVHSIEPDLSPKYNKFYIGLAHDGQAKNFVVFRPQKNVVKVSIRLNQDSELEQQLEDAGLDVTDYDKRGGRYHLRIRPGEVDTKRDVLTEVLRRAHSDFSRS
ncbi:hypothetical protein ACFLR0_00770 [Candidatus Bipolaricaulota bacterium]